MFNQALGISQEMRPRILLRYSIGATSEHHPQSLPALKNPKSVKGHKSSPQLREVRLNLRPTSQPRLSPEKTEQARIIEKLKSVHHSKIGHTSIQATNSFLPTH